MAVSSVVKKVVITGANGYVGRHFVEFLLSYNVLVVALVRDPEKFQMQGVESFPYSMEVEPDIAWFKGANAVVHLAAIASQTSLDDQVEYDACLRLLEIVSLDEKNKFIFVSSQSSSAHSPTKYGRTKWRLEQLVSSLGGVIVRPGLVYGGDKPGALFSALCSIVKKLPILPVLVPCPRVQPIHIDDLSLSLLKSFRLNGLLILICE